ncbi:MipA/OmpV family protein [Cupriavidus sp. CuC1]|uniref:MipA/OmpV family protein n=1 Tax=Cupriavidus sp. CuC1 TaxID=3373131 RepID=UPI0037D8E071
MTDAQAANSQFRPYTTKAGFDRASLAVSWEYEISRAWSVNSTVAVTRMLGDSGNSPIVRIARSGQTSPERT